jgi:hypothetical protein
MRAAEFLHRLPRREGSAQQERGRRWRAHARRKPAPSSIATRQRAAQVSTRPISTPEASTLGQDSAVARVRDAGGPIDNASYTCACGFVFAASVSTTVACPHCGASQAW